MKRMQHPTAIARWLFFAGLAIVATLTSAGGTNAAALSYADMYYKVEVATPSTTANFTTAEHQGGGRWWEMAASQRPLTRIGTVPVEYTAALSTLAEPFSMDFFGISGGGFHGLSPFIDGYSGILSMTPHRPCMPTHRSACATLSYGGGLVTGAQCRSRFGPNTSTQVPNEPTPTSGNDSGNNKNQTSDNPTSYETFRMRNVGIPWTAISLFGEKMYSHTTAAWTDASKCCLVLLVNTATADSSSVWNGGRLRGEVELCRNGTVTLRYEEVPFVPSDRRADVLARCLRLAESNSTDPDFILEPFVGLSANEHMSISLPPPRWVTTTNDRQLSVVAYRITPRHLLVGGGFNAPPKSASDATPFAINRPTTTLKECSAVWTPETCSVIPACVWCWGALPPAGRDLVNGRGRCMHDVEASAFCPPGQASRKLCDAAVALMNSGVRYFQSSVAHPGRCDSAASSSGGETPAPVGEGAGHTLPHLTDCYFRDGAAHCGHGLFRLYAASAPAALVSSIPEFRNATQRRVSAVSEAMDYTTVTGRIEALINPSSSISFTFCHKRPDQNTGFAPTTSMMIGFSFFKYGQLADHPELHAVQGVTIEFTPVRQQVFCPDANATLPACPVGYGGTACQYCVAGYQWFLFGCRPVHEPPSPPSGDDGGLGPRTTNSLTLTGVLLVLLACFCLLLVMAAALAVFMFGPCRTDQIPGSSFLRRRSSQPAGDRVDVVADVDPDDTPATFPVYRDAFAPLLRRLPTQDSSFQAAHHADTDDFSDTSL